MESTVSEAGINISKINKSIFTIGIRKDGTTSKSIGIRPNSTDNHNYQFELTFNKFVTDNVSINNPNLYTTHALVNDNIDLSDDTSLHIHDTGINHCVNIDSITDELFVAQYTVDYTNYILSSNHNYDASEYPLILGLIILDYNPYPIDYDPDSLILSKQLKKLNHLLENKISLIDFIWHKLTFGKNYNTPEKKAALEEEIDVLVNKIKDFKVRKNYTNFFKQKFFEKFNFKLNKIEKYKTQENLANKEIINANKIIERVLIGSIILFPNLLSLIKKKFFSIDFQTNDFNNIKNFILKLYNSEKLIENSNLRTKLLSSGYQEIVNKLIDKSIFIHAPFLKNLRNDFEKIVKGWNEYWDIYIKKNDFKKLKKEADIILNDLNEKNYSKLKNLQSHTRKNYL